MSASYVGYSNGTAGDEPEEGGDDVKSAWPLCPGLHTRYNGQYNGSQNRKVEPILKAGLSSDCRLQLACMKLELLVTAGQHTAVNMFPGLVHTARHVMKADNTRSRWANRKEAAVEGGIGDWDEVVTR